MALRRYVVPVTTIADGSATAYSPPIYGSLISINYVLVDYAAGVDFVITAETTGETIWSELNVNASATRYPRSATHSTAGVAALYAAAGVAVLTKIALGGDRVKIVIAQGGNVKTGTFHITVDG